MSYKDVLNCLVA